MEIGHVDTSPQWRVDTVDPAAAEAVPATADPKMAKDDIRKQIAPAVVAAGIRKYPSPTARNSSPRNVQRTAISDLHVDWVKTKSKQLIPAHLTVSKISYNNINGRNL